MEGWVSPLKTFLELHESSRSQIQHSRGFFKREQQEQDGEEKKKSMSEGQPYIFAANDAAHAQNMWKMECKRAVGK